MTNTCGCCEGIEQIPPMPMYNRPGLNALLYRVGTHATFFETMQARLSSLSIPLSELGPLLPLGTDGTQPVYPLQSLTTRDLSDPAIALLDAWAIVGDVFTFYQERLANEGYLRTATLRRSVLELARLMNYKLRPGVASSVYLAFTLSSGNDTLIPTGTRAQNIPAAGQLPQSFETSVDLQTHAVWSNLLPRMSLPQNITKVTLPGTLSSVIDTNVPDGALYLTGIATGLKPHDPVLFVFDDNPNDQIFAHVQKVTPNPAAKYTTVTFPLAFTPRVYNTNLLYIVNRYYNVAAFGLPGDNASPEQIQQIQQVLSDLSNIGTMLSPPQAPLLSDAGIVNSVFYNTISGYLLSDWDDIHEQAVGSPLDEQKLGTSTPGDIGTALLLANWIGGLINDMTNILKEIQNLPTDASTATGGLVQSVRQAKRSFVLTEPEFGSTPITSLGTLFAPLKQPLSIQPASSALLPRKIGTSFARTGDIAAQLLTTFLPQISSTLYAAYSTAQVTRSTQLENVYALRVKAAPFGSNAPKQAITTQSTGKPVTFTTNYIEWLIAESAFVNIQVSPYDTGNPLRETVQLTFRQGGILEAVNVGQTSSGTTIDIPYTQTVSFPSSIPVINITVGVTTTGTTSKTLDTITITSDTGLSFKLTLDSNNKWNVDIDKTNVYPLEIEYDAQNNLNVSLVAPNAATILDLDARYDHIVPETWVVIESTSVLPNQFPLKAVKIQNVETVARADYGISAKVTRLTLYEHWLTSDDLKRNPCNLSLYRGINVYAQSEVLPLATVPVTDDVAGNTVELNDIYNGLQSGNYVIVTGERTDIPNTTGVIASELMTLQSVTQDATRPGDTVHTTLHFATGLVHTYKRSTVGISGNVVAATQGETQNQILGSGDGSQSMQQFSLSKVPLTYVPAVTPTGEASTLQVRVNNILWHETDSLDGTQPSDRVYITQTDDDDKVTITFGNGSNGARLPTGAENVKAVYRTGIGTSGNVDAGKITALVSRPLGVTGVNNPLPATGGADRETRDSARDNIPLASAALGRIVSLQDYSYFTRTFAGIGKASAANLSDGLQQVVYLTIAGQDNIPIDTTSGLYQNLVQSLQTFGDPSTPFMLALANVKLMILSARVNIGADYLFDDVATALRIALLDAFSFARRDLGQPVFASEVLSVMQQVAGVVYVDLAILDAINQQQLIIALQKIQADQLNAANGGSQATKPSTADLVKLLGLTKRLVVPSSLAQPDSKHAGEILPAEIVFLSSDVPDTLILNQLTTLHFTPA